MKKLLLVCLITFSSVMIAMEDAAELSFCRLQKEQAEALIALEERATSGDKRRIVVLPNKFRLGAAQKDIEAGKFFGAFNADNALLSMAKLFLLEGEERTGTLRDEIRCIDQSPEQACIMQFEGDEVKRSEHSDPESIGTSAHLVLYLGKQFTDPERRNQGVNKRLVQYSLKELKDAIELSSKQVKEEPVVFGLCFGLTQENTGDDILSGRGMPNLKLFKQIVGMLGSEDPMISIARYRAFMPTFDPESLECKPLPDEYSVPGFGYMLTAKLS